MDTRFRLAGGAAEALRADLGRETSQRLQVLGIVAMALWVIYYVLGVWVFPRVDDVAHAAVGHGRCLGGFLVSLALYVAARSGRVGPTLLMYSGLVSMVVISGFIASFNATRDVLARPAAIKIIRAEKLGMSNSRAERMTLRRFEREAQATAAL